MTRRLAVLLTVILLTSVSGCVFAPGHRHCCWRYGAIEQPSAAANLA